MPRLGEIVDGARGLTVEFGTISLNPASIAAGAVLETNVSGVTGADTTDLVFLNPVNLDTGLVCVGARVTDADNIKVKLYNPTAGAVDGAAVTYQYLLVKVA